MSVEDEIAAFVRERDEALLSLDAEKIQAFANRHRAGIPPSDHPSFWIGVHKARSAARSLPEEARRESVRWLKERGYTHMADDLEPL